jgi:ADP-ribose pyrophosphatase YjhB (NUDIX family)
VPTPDFVLRLREKIGHDPLPLVGVTGVVLDASGRVLLTLRSDTRRWALIGGIVEPGEPPARAIVREVLEETGVEAELSRFVAVIAEPPRRYPNGDQVQFLTLQFVLRALSGHARVADDESLEVRWFPLDDLPALSEPDEARLARALAPAAPTYFEL